MKSIYPNLTMGSALFLNALAGAIIFVTGHLVGLSAMSVYFLLYFLLVISNRSVYLISPLSIVHAYYFVFFILAPAFAEIHQDDDFSAINFYLIYGMIYYAHLFVSFGVSFGERYATCSLKSITPRFEKNGFAAKNILLLLLYILATASVVAIVQSSGGLAYWISAPGDAFLNRAGSGVFVVMSHFFTFLLASMSGYKSYVSRKKVYVLAFILWLAVTSPVHGSKQLISIFLSLAFLPWISSVRMMSAKSAIFSSVLILVFFFGLYLRNISWITVEDALPYALNYFTTLRNMVLLLQDFNAGFMETFFLPFNKFLTPFGLEDMSLYFDMNHMLTDKYFPTAWEIRATEQWPVEADLYLNFFYVFGLPVAMAYGFAVGIVSGLARKSNSLGMWVVLFLVTFSVISHLRGSIYNHVDFYLYPMFYLIYRVLKNYPISVEGKK